MRFASGRAHPSPQILLPVGRSVLASLARAPYVVCGGMCGMGGMYGMGGGMPMGRMGGGMPMGGGMGGDMSGMGGIGGAGTGCR